MQTDKAFRAKVAEARVYRKFHSLKTLYESTEWRAHAFYLKMMHPEEFGDKIAVQHTGSDGGPIKSEVKVVTREDFKGLSLERLLELRDKVREEEAEESNRIAQLN